MPLLIFAFGLVAVVVVILLCLPLSIFQRYRMGTARRRARAWLASINAWGMGLSALLFLLGALVTNFWIPGALSASFLGILAGCLLGLLGLALTRWESGANCLHYTPNRWLVLSITVIIALRIGFGLWRTWHGWHSASEHQSWLQSAGIADSMAAGAVVLGYYLAFWTGIYLRVKRIR